MVVDFLGHQELCVLRPAVGFFRQLDLVFAERFAVGSRRVLFVRSSPGDVAVEDDERRALGFLLSGADRAVDGFDVIGVADPKHVPVIAHEACAHVFGKGERGVAFNRDLVIVVNPDQVRKPEVPGDGSCFGRYAFHQVAVAADRINAVIDRLAGRRD